MRQKKIKAKEREGRGEEYITVANRGEEGRGVEPERLVARDDSVHGGETREARYHGMTSERETLERASGLGLRGRDTERESERECKTEQHETLT